MLSVGVHIEEGVAVRTAALSFHNGKTAFEGGFSFPLSESQDETAAALESVSVLKTVLQQYENQPARFCFALPQSRTACFMSSFPFSEKFKILKTLPFEIEEKTVFQPDSVLFDSRISSRFENGAPAGGFFSGRRRGGAPRNGPAQGLGASGFDPAGSGPGSLAKNKGRGGPGAQTGAGTHVLSFVALKENVSAFLAPLERLKIKPWLLSAEGAAFANLAEALQKAERLSFPSVGSSRRIYLHLGLKSVLTLFFENGFLKDASALNGGFEPVLREMAEKYKLSFERAQEEFNEKAFVLTAKKGFSKEQEAFSALIQKHLEPLVKDLKLRKLSFEGAAPPVSRFGGGSDGGPGGSASGSVSGSAGNDSGKEEENPLPWEIFITGPGAVIRNLSSYLSLKLSLPVYRVKPLEKTSFDCKEEDLLIATGLAMEGLKPPPWSGLNFLRSVQTGKSRFLSLPKPIFLLIFLAALAYSFVRREEAARLSERAHEVFASAAKKIAFIRESRLSEEKVRQFLRKRESRTVREDRIRHVLQSADAMDHLKTLTKHLKETAREGHLKIRLMEIDKRNVHIEGLIKESHALQLKRRIEILGEKGTLTRRPSSFADKPSSRSEGTDSKADPGVASGTDPKTDDPAAALSGAAKAPEKSAPAEAVPVTAKNRGAHTEPLAEPPLSEQSSDAEQGPGEKMIAFSYSFILRNNL